MVDILIITKSYLLFLKSHDLKKQAKFMEYFTMMTVIRAIRMTGSGTFYNFKCFWL